MEKYELAIDKWADEMIEEFNEAIKDLLDVRSNPDFIIDMASSLAHNFIQTGNCYFFESYDLNDSHAYCFLNHVSGNFRKEVENAFDECRSD